MFTRGYSDQNPPGWLKMGPAFRVEDFKASNTSFSLARCTSAIRGQDLRLKKHEKTGIKCQIWWIMKDVWNMDTIWTNDDFLCHIISAIWAILSDDCHAAWSSEVQAIHSPVPQQSFPGRTNRVSGSCPRPRFSWKQDFLETGHGPSFGEVVLHLSAQDLGY